MEVKNAVRRDWRNVPMVRFLKQFFERRSASLMAMIGTGLVVFFMFYLIRVDVRNFLDYLDQALEPGLTAEMRLLWSLEISLVVIKVLLDIYLLLVGLLIFIQALNECFGRKISAIEGWEFAAYLFLISNIDSLKTRLIGLVLARLVLGLFQRGLRLEPERLPALLTLAPVILLVAIALFLSYRCSATGPPSKPQR
jgi:uncharacterized membrane protein YqhA